MPADPARAPRTRCLRTVPAATLGPQVPQSPWAQAPLPCGAPPRRLQDQDERLRALLLSHQCPVSQGRGLQASLAQRRAPRNRPSGPATAPQPALAAFPVPRRRPRAPRPAPRRRPGARLLPVQRALRRGVRRWRARAVGPRGCPGAARAARSSSLLPPPESPQPPREQRFLILGNFLNEPGQAPHFLPAAPQRPGAPCAQRPPVRSLRPVRPPAPSAPLRLMPLGAPCAQDARRAQGGQLQPERSRILGKGWPQRPEVRGKAERSPLGAPPASLAQAGPSTQRGPLPTTEASAPATCSPFLLG